MKIQDLLSQAVARCASDVFIVPGSPVVAYKINGEILPEPDQKMRPEDT